MISISFRWNRFSRGLPLANFMRAYDSGLYQSPRTRTIRPRNGLRRAGIWLSVMTSVASGDQDHAHSHSGSKFPGLKLMDESTGKSVSNFNLVRNRNIAFIVKPPPGFIQNNGTTTSPGAWSREIVCVKTIFIRAIWCRGRGGRDAENNLRYARPVTVRLVKEQHEPFA